MIITISGTPGSGKSTVGRVLAKKLGYKHNSSGDFMKDMAEERKISLLELSKQAEVDRSIDEDIDRKQIEIGKNEDDFVIDGRLSFHFIPNSVKIFLDAKLKERAGRIYKDRVRQEENVTPENTQQNIKTREESEKKRYLEYYKLDPYDKKHYDLVVDTTNMTPEQAVEKIIKFIQKEKT